MKIIKIIGKDKTPKKYELSVEIGVRSLEGQYESNHNIPDTVF